MVQGCRVHSLGSVSRRSRRHLCQLGALHRSKRCLRHPVVRKTIGDGFARWPWHLVRTGDRRRRVSRARRGSVAELPDGPCGRARTPDCRTGAVPAQWPHGYRPTTSADSHEAIGQEQHQYDNQESEHGRMDRQEAPPYCLFEHEKHGGADHRSEQGAKATEQNHHQWFYGQQDVEDIAWIDVMHPTGIDAAGYAWKQSRESERGSLVPPRIDSEHDGGVFILLDKAQRKADLSACLLYTSD